MGGCVVFFLAMKSRSQGPKGRKVQNQARKTGKENQGRVVVDGEGRTDGALGQEDRASERASLAPSALNLALSLCHWVGSSRAADSNL